MKQLIEFVLTQIKGKKARYIAMLAAGILLGSGMASQYPEENARFWAQPLPAIVLIVFAVVSSNKATKEWNAKVEKARNEEPQKQK